MNTITVIINDCPFCAGPAVVVWWPKLPSGSARVRCKHCGALGADGATREIAVTRWDRRAIDAKEDEIIEDMAICLEDCLVRIFPEEFEPQRIQEAAQRFSGAGGTIARISGLIDKAKDGNEHT